MNEAYIDGTGFGARFTLFDRLYNTFTVAFPLRKSPLDDERHDYSFARDVKLMYYIQASLW